MKRVAVLSLVFMGTPMEQLRTLKVISLELFQRNSPEQTQYSEATAYCL